MSLSENQLADFLIHTIRAVERWLDRKNRLFLHRCASFCVQTKFLPPVCLRLTQRQIALASRTLSTLLLRLPFSRSHTSGHILDHRCFALATHYFNIFKALF